MRIRSVVVFLALAVLELALVGRAAITDPVKVEQGLLAGTSGSTADIRLYRGIPFAAPPVGDLRWKAPQPAASWQGTRQAAEFSNACWQTPYPAAAAIYQAKLPRLSEDCLYLNIWTPTESAKDRLPVMVWIHGGGFTRGFSGTSSYNGEVLARKGAIFITINYRLGIFGFFAHPELSAESAHHASGNYALLDQIAALQWVQKNIAAFGGDPNRVTIFGESAGSWAVNALMASPLAKGLFQRAIGESGGLFSPMKTLAEAEKEGEKLATGLTSAPIAEAKADAGQSSTPPPVLKALRAKSAEELLKAADSETVRTVVDGWVLPQDVTTIFAQGKQNDVPLIVGYNADEGTALAPQAANMKAFMFIGGVHQRYGSQADALLKVYPAGSDEEAVSSFYSAYRDQAFGWEMRTWARMATKTGHQPAYMYYFSRRPPGPQSARLRAFHASEIAYVFGTFVWPFPWEDTDKKLSDAMTSYWVNFAASGNPNGGRLTKWPVYNAKDDQALEFGDQITVRSEVNKAGLDFFDGYYQSVAETKKSGAAATAK
ncbi:MAG TPA: carboxylesterase/lipase family protein [Candidatus Polarisedimenticolia bacterium]|nr:carboxylesterase/lipase family protein [Candidatus Polarisedimenticolia bacterium]